MRILIVSDTHGLLKNFHKALKKVGDIDYLIHAGDVSGDEQEIRESVSCPVKIVSGNNDFSFSLKKEEEFDICDHHFLLLHGHREGVYYGTDRLSYKASEYGADVVIFGHTHVPSIEYDEELGIWIVNPGSLTFPRQGDRRPTFLLMEIDNEGELHFTLNFVD